MLTTSHPLFPDGDSPLPTLTLPDTPLVTTPADAIATLPDPDPVLVPLVTTTLPPAPVPSA